MVAVLSINNRIGSPTPRVETTSMHVGVGVGSADKRAREKLVIGLSRLVLHWICLNPTILQ